MRDPADLLMPFRWELTRVSPDTMAVAVDTGSLVFVGHYPGWPVVPGVCLIDLVRQAADAMGLAPWGTTLVVHRARFVDPVLPGHRLEVTITPVGRHEVSGEVRHGEGVACRVRLRGAEI